MGFLFAESRHSTVLPPPLLSGFVFVLPSLKEKQVDLMRRAIVFTSGLAPRHKF
jgi:hypothetical protein